MFRKTYDRRVKTSTLFKIIISVWLITNIKPKKLDLADSLVGDLRSYRVTKNDHICLYIIEVIDDDSLSYLTSF